MTLPPTFLGFPLDHNMSSQKTSQDDLRHDLRQAKREIELLKTMVSIDYVECMLVNRVYYKLRRIRYAQVRWLWKYK